MNLEQIVSQKLNQHPKIKTLIKRAYQRTAVALSPPFRASGNISRISPNAPGEFFFGYYDKSPESADGRYVLSLKAENAWSETAPKAPAEILLIDTESGGRAETIARTHTWNVQQGCMAQWLGPAFDREIIYNDFQDGKFCSVILDVFSGEKRVLSMPVYSVSLDGSFALSLDFARLHRLRPGYGYSNLPDRTAGERCPASPCIWRLNLDTGEAAPVLQYTDFAAFEPRPEMSAAEHKVNHIMLSPGGTRFMVLHRWLAGGRKYSRLVTADTDGGRMYNLLDDDMVSHCCWKDDETILAFARKKGEGFGYFLLQDRAPTYRRLWPGIEADGHPSYSPDKSLVVTDSYPNRRRVASVRVLTEASPDSGRIIAKVFAPFRYDNETRCDLHPRWSRDGQRIYFDATFEGSRGLYAVPVPPGISSANPEDERESSDSPKRRIRIVYLLTVCKRSGPVQQTLNILKNLDANVFEPFLVTLYDEPADSRIGEYMPYVSAHYQAKLGKAEILLNRTGNLRRILELLHPDVIHTFGVFPDYAVSQIGNYRQILTLRNYIYEDYPAKFGRIRGSLLAAMQLRAVRRCGKAVCCSESLSNIYREKLGLSLDFIRNGVDLEKYTKATDEEKQRLRERLSIPADAFVFVYTGQFIKRKNIPFLLENYAKAFPDESALLILLGDGPEWEPLRTQYADCQHIVFRGAVSNVGEYLNAGDAYLSASFSEGMPNGVLEAMAAGLPVALSDIPQHREIFESAKRPIGFLFPPDDGPALIRQLKSLRYDADVPKYAQSAYETAHRNFSASGMSARYAQIYKKLVQPTGME